MFILDQHRSDRSGVILDESADCLYTPNYEREHGTSKKNRDHVEKCRNPKLLNPELKTEKAIRPGT